MMVVVMMAITPPVTVMMVMVMVAVELSDLDVIFCSGLFVHCVQQCRRVGDRFEQFGERIRSQRIAGVRRWGSLGYAERRHRAQQSGDRFMHNPSFNFLRRVQKPVGGNAALSQRFREPLGPRSGNAIFWRFRQRRPRSKITSAAG